MWEETNLLLDISQTEKKSDKLFIVNYLLSSTLCMCTVFINLTGILVVPQKAAQCKFCIFWCNFQFLSPYMFCGWNSTLPHNSSFPRLCAPLWNPPPALLPKADWTTARAAFPPLGWVWQPKAKGGAAGEPVKRCEAKLGSGACVGSRKAAVRCVQAGLAGCPPAPQPSQKACKHLTWQQSTPQLPLI